MISKLLLSAALACAVAGPAQAQFTLPGGPAAEGAPLPPPQRLTYSYAYGAEAPLTYRHNRDLDSRLSDDSLVFKAKVFGSIAYRPADWLTLLVEGKLGRETPIHEQAAVTLPSGDLAFAPHRKPTLLVEQALISARQAPWEFNLGRRNYEDERHWLYDGSIDVASLTYRHENWRAEAMIGRDVLWSLDALQKAKKHPIEIAMLNADYRGFDGHTLGAYAIKRNDLAGHEGKPIYLGLKAHGKPTAAFSYWAEAVLLRGADENGARFKAHALDMGGTYRFAELPFDPNVTLAFANGSGDNNAADKRNTEFRQTGLQTNEARYIGLSKFKAYGEMLDSDLSNLRVFTVGIGARATPGISVDLIYHRYQLNAIASEIRNWGFTAQMNTVPGLQSRDLGQELDLVIGFRGLFDIRRFGLDLRVGKFFPGKAFRTSDGGSGFRRADNALTMVAKFRY